MSQSKFIHESKLLLKLAGPIVLGQVGQNLITLADTIMVGALGPSAMGASAFAGSIFYLFLLFGIGLLAPLAALIAKAEGQGDYPQGGSILKHSVLIALGTGLFFSLVLYPCSSLLAYLGQTEDVHTLGRPFFEILVLSLLPVLIFQAYKQFTDGIGQTKVAMFVMAFGVIINIIGNDLLIHGRWIFPELGLMGSAYATLFSRILMSLLMIFYVHTRPQFKHYFKEPWTHRFNHYLIKSIIRLGIPNGLTFLFEVGAFTAAAIMMGWFGAGPLAAHQITLSLASTSFLVTLGVGIASSIRVGYELGRKDFSSARYAGLTAIKMGAFYMSLCAVGFYFLRNWFPPFYVSDPDVISLAAQFFIVVALFQISDGVQAVAIGSLRGLSDTQWPSVIALIAYWVLGLPGGYILAFHGGFGPVGIWLGLLIGLTAAAIMLTLRFHLLSRRYLRSF